jgi:hypothetical protein
MVYVQAGGGESFSSSQEVIFLDFRLLAKTVQLHSKRKMGPMAFHHPAPEVFLNALRRGGGHGPQGRGFELEAVLFVAEPRALGRNPFPGTHGGQRPHDRHKITMPGSLHPQNAKAGVLIEIRDSLDEPFDSIGTRSLARRRLTHKRHSPTRSPPTNAIENVILYNRVNCCRELLLLKWLHHLSKANWSLSNLASMLRLNLFTYRELAQWIDNPMGTPPLIPAAEQLTLALV